MAACKLTPMSMLSVVPITETNVAQKQMLLMETLTTYFITVPDSARRYS